MRQRRRYVAFELGGTNVSESEMIRTLDGLSPAPVKLILYDAESRRGLVRCGQTQLREIKEALSKVEEIGGRKASLKVLGVSGTIRAAKRKFLFQI